MQCPLSRPSDNPAIIDGSNTLTYRDCQAHVSGIAIALNKQGIGPGSVVTFTPDHSIATILTFFALFRLQAIAAPLSPRLPTAQIPHMISKMRATHRITPRLYEPAVGQTTIDLSSPATYICTSGTTANPKIAIHTLGNHFYSAIGVNSYFKLEQTDRWHLSLPLFHVAGLAILFRCFFAGASVVLNGDFTHASWVPTQLGRYLNDQMPHLKAILIGGAALPPDLAFRASHLPLYSSYGLTEMSSTVLIKNTPLPYRRVKIVNGELHVAGPPLFQGYIGEPRRRSWYATGDLVSDTYAILGRKDRLFISGGENIQPEEIENALLSLPGVTIAHVLPIKDCEFGKRPVAYTDVAYDTQLLEKLLPKFKHPIAQYRLDVLSKYPKQAALDPTDL